MAKRLTVPSFQEESTGNRARGAGAGGPGNFGRAFVQDTTLTDAGAGFAKLGDIMEGISAQRDSVASVKAETAALVAMDAKIGALDPLAPDYQDQVKAVAEDAKRQTLESSGITNSSVKDDLTRRMERNVASTLISAGHIQKAAVGKETERIAGESVDMISAKIRNDPGNANAYMTEFQGNMERLKIGMDPARVPAFAAAAADTFAKNQVIGYAEKGNIGGARTALKEQAQYLKGETVTGLSSYIDGRESKFRTDAARSSAVTTADMLVHIDDMASGVKPFDPDFRAKIDAANKSGVWANNPSGYVAAVTHYNNMVQKVGIEAAKNQKAVESLNGGTYAAESPETQQRAANVVLGPMPAGTVLDQANAKNVVAFVAQHGAAFPQLANAIESAGTANVGDPKAVDRAANAAAIMDEADARNGNIEWKFKEPDSIRAIRAKVKASNGAVSYKEAATQVLANTPDDKTDAKMRLERFTGGDKANFTPEAITKTVDSNFSRGWMEAISANVGGEGMGRAAIPAEVYGYAHDRMKYYYVDQKMDAETAKTLAMEDMKKVWGVTGTGGSNRVMQYPPDKTLMGIIPGLGQKQAAEVINSMVRPVLSAAGKGDTDFRLTADSVTRSQMANGVRPDEVTWRVQVVTPQGAVVDMPTRFNLKGAETNEIVTKMRAEQDKVIREAPGSGVGKELGRFFTPEADLGGAINRSMESGTAKYQAAEKLRREKEAAKLDAINRENKARQDARDEEILKQKNRNGVR